MVREYVGGGPLGELAARKDAEEREHREAEVTRRRAEVQRLEELAAPLVELCEVAPAGALEDLGHLGHVGRGY